jgi:hypothetical protein
VHTLKVIGGGLALLALCLLVARWIGSPRSSSALASGALAFIPLWLAGAALNMWVGVSRAGYSIREEAPVFAVVFAVPAALALVLWRIWSRS